MSRMTLRRDLEIEDRDCVTLLPCWTRLLTSCCWFFSVGPPRAPQRAIFREVVYQGTCRLLTPSSLLSFYSFLFRTPVPREKGKTDKPRVKRRLQRLEKQREADLACGLPVLLRLPQPRSFVSSGSC